jgi:hypothetical protein
MADWSEGFKLEMQIVQIITEQAKHGVNFDSKKASWYAHILSEKMVNIDKELVPLLPPMMNLGTSYKKPFVLSGKFSKWVGIYADRVGLKRSEVGGPFTAIWYTPFDPGKIAKVKEVMLDYGWAPNEWNFKKQDINTHGVSKRLKRKTYSNFLDTLAGDEREFYELRVDAFVEKHFKGRSIPYMKQILGQLGFKQTPKMGEIKKKLLMSKYWVTSPKIDPDKDKWIGEGNARTGELLSTRMQISHRRSLLQGLLKVVRPDGKIPAEANTCGTPTARFKHRKIVNIPASGAYFGKECRSLFLSDNNSGSKAFMLDTGKEKIFIPKNRDIFVGGDASGLELRILTHYLIKVCSDLLGDAQGRQDGKDIHRFQVALKSAYTYRETLLEGDIHSHNQKLAGLPTRSAAKSMIYAHNYGAGDAKLGTLVGGGAAEGAKMRTRFLKECPAIAVLIEWAKNFAERGWLPGLDGRKLIMRTDEYGNAQTHKALNTLLQAGGSIVVKQATVILDRLNKERKVNCHQVIHMHDEYQFTCKKDHVSVLMNNIEKCVTLAGEHYDMECPLASDSMQGASWYDCH